MDQHGLRATALATSRRCSGSPAWGEQRITGMIENRPDWCISRQRTWGVPIRCSCIAIQRRAASATPARCSREVAARVEQGGIDAWFDLDPRELLGAEAATTTRSPDVMDVWADSGVVITASGRRGPRSGPADLYLEGSDQHRGWFHSRC
jgi:isoleucyl-tRNA synthetase